MMPSTAALWLCCLIRDPRRRSMGAVTCETRDPADSRMDIGRGGALCGASDVGALLESLRLAAQAGFESLGFVLWDGCRTRRDPVPGAGWRHPLQPGSVAGDLPGAAGLGH